MPKQKPEVNTRKTATDKNRNKDDADNDVGIYEEKSVAVSDMEDKGTESKNRGCKRKNVGEGKEDELRCNTLESKREKNDAASTLQEQELQMENQDQIKESFLETNVLQHLENEETKKALTNVLYLQMKDAIRRLTEASAADQSHPSAVCLFHHNGCKDFAHPPETSKTITGQLDNKVTKAEGAQLEGFSHTQIPNLNVKSNSDGISKENKLEGTDQDKPSDASTQMSDEALNVKLAAEALSLLRNNGRSVCKQKEECDKKGPRRSLQASSTASSVTSPKSMEKQKDVKKSSAMKQTRILFDATLEITDALTGVKIPFESLHLDNNHSTGKEENKSDRSVTFRALNGQKTECIIPETLLQLSDTVTCIKVPLKPGTRCTIAKTVKTVKTVKTITSNANDKIIQVTNTAPPEKMPIALKMRDDTTTKANVRVSDSTDTSTSVKIPLEAVDLSEYFRDGGQDHMEYSKLLENQSKSVDKTEFRILDLSQYQAKKLDKTGCSENSLNLASLQSAISPKPDLQRYGKTSKYSIPKANIDTIGTFSLPAHDGGDIKHRNIFTRKIQCNTGTQSAADVKTTRSNFQLEPGLNKPDCQKSDIDSTIKVEETEDNNANLCHGGPCDTSSVSKNISDHQKTVKETAENLDSNILTVIKSEPIDVLEFCEEENKINSSSADQLPAEHLNSPDHPFPFPNFEIKTEFDMSLPLENGEPNLQIVKTENETSEDNLNAFMTPRDAFSLLINDEIILKILKHTNVKLASLSLKSKNRNSFKHSTNHNELKAFFGLLLISGALRQNTTNIPELWSECFGAGIYRATFHEPRFLILSKCICLGDIASQDNCVGKNEFPQSGEIWEEYLRNCKSHFSPFITTTGTVDNTCGQLYSTARKTVHMPLRILYSMLDGAGVRGLAIFRRQNPYVKLSQREFLKQVGMSLVTPHLQARMKKVTLRRSVRELIESILNKKNENSTKSSMPPNGNALIKQKRCQLCPWNRDRKTKHRCVSCLRAICKKHRSDMCVDCGKNVG